jgi:hypothetical protein
MLRAGSISFIGCKFSGDLLPRVVKTFWKVAERLLVECGHLHQRHAVEH